ncbi:hypothetical protein FB45DRAFT_921822 [Roridomyces roridus]|uniref:SUZ domain-containing protein n=1 Tax=Roridomyces roridus TaxID=1738132 RepID=A0AAD7BML5_9AGAR|nr:hypothetical protein FB45DRAFT_921822 [Roridomyces roridus]
MSLDVPRVTNSPPPVTIMSPPQSSSSNSSVISLLQATDAAPQHEVDPQILEALASKDRIYVLKLGELMEGLIGDRTLSRQRIDFAPATSYQKLLVHRCSAYYGLSLETDGVTKAITVSITSESRIPPRRIAELVPPQAEAAPKFKIMMRTPRSQTGSVTGDDGDVSDGSLGGRSSASTSKHRLTIEERTAAYNEARNRIFIDFNEKEQKDTTSSASSSASLVSSSSTSASDDPGSPATESENNAPHRANSTSSSRSLRGSAAPFMSSNSSSSSRNSRAPSPAFKYASPLRAPATWRGLISVPPYDPTHAHAHSTPNFQAPNPQGMQFYPYPAHPMPQGQQPPYIAPPYPYYPSYGPYSHPPTPPSDPEVYAYNVYQWSAPYPPPAPQNGAGTPPTQNPNLVQPNQNNGVGNGSPPYPAYMLCFGATTRRRPPLHHRWPNGTPYAHVPYYPPPPHGHIPMPPYMPPQQVQAFEVRPNGNGNRGGANGRSRNGINGGGAGGKGRGGNPPPQRAAWSFGPGVSGGPTLMRDAVGPRLSGPIGMGTSMRRGSSGNRTVSTSGSSSTGDDVSSVASSSTTSSSSRRTYTSTTSSTHHPLPARPDWAVGLRPNPTLHAPRHHDSAGHSHSNSRTMSPISPSRALNGSGSSSPHQLSTSSLRQQQLQQEHTQSLSPLHMHIQEQQALTDFPPLSGPTEKPRSSTAPVAGAWTNSSSIRSIVMNQAGGSALVAHHSGEKGAGEAFHPKGIVRRPTTGRVEGSVNGAGVTGAAAVGKEKDKDRARGDAVANAILVSHVAGISLEERAQSPGANTSTTGVAAAPSTNASPVAFAVLT